MAGKSVLVVVLYLLLAHGTLLCNTKQQYVLGRNINYFPKIWYGAQTVENDQQIFR